MVFAVLSAVVPHSLSAQWELINDNGTVSSFDMLTTRIGLVGMELHFQQILARYDNGVVTGFTNTTGKITSIVIRDTNVAYLSVEGDGIYEASNHWSILKRIVAAGQSSVLCVKGNTIIASVNGVIKYSVDATQFFIANGIEPLNPLTAVEAITSTQLLGVGSNMIYRSINSGSTWVPILDTTILFNSVYVDTVHDVYYAGGSALLRSFDHGAHWDPVTNSFFIPLSGPVLGARDCSGTFYLGPDNAIHGELYRSINQGKFFQSVGPAYLSSTKLQKAVVLDRGSTVFWLIKSGLWTVTHIGVDSAIVDMVRDRVRYTTDTTLHSSLCINAPSAVGFVEVTYDQCTGIVLDSLIPSPFNPAFTIPFSPRLLTDGSTNLTVYFKAKHLGPDSATFRIRYHSPTTQNVENIVFSVYGFGETTGAFLSLPQNSVEFGTVGVDSTRKRKITFSNTGCDSFRIDSIVSSSMTYFPIDLKSYPIELPGGKDYSVEVRFTPNAEGEYLEAITLATSLGIRYVTLHGFGASHGGGDTLSIVPQSKTITPLIFPNPAHSTVVLSGISTDRISDLKLIDAIGKTHESVILNNNGTSITIDLSQLTPGVYTIVSNWAHIRQKIIRY